MVRARKGDVALEIKDKIVGISDSKTCIREEAGSGIKSHTLSFGFISPLTEEEIEIYGVLTARTW